MEPKKRHSSTKTLSSSYQKTTTGKEEGGKDRVHSALVKGILARQLEELYTCTICDCAIPLIFQVARTPRPCHVRCDAGSELEGMNPKVQATSGSYRKTATSKEEKVSRQRASCARRRNLATLPIVRSSVSCTFYATSNRLGSRIIIRVAKFRSLVDWMYARV
jgi:hypothetical protein